MTVAYSYARFSSLVQASGRSEDRQDETFRRACEQNGWTPAEVAYIDRGRSAYQTRNGKARNLSGDLGAFLQAIESKAVKPGSVLVVENPDRLTRCGFDETYDIIRSVVRSSVSIYWADRGILISRNSLRDNLAVVIQLAVEAERAFSESRVKSERSRDNWSAIRRRAREGAAHGKRVPGWLKLVDGKYELEPERSALVRRIFRMVADENCGFYQVAKTLNAEGVPTWRGGKRWSTFALRWIVHNRQAIGEYIPRSDGKPVDAIPGYYPAVVDEDLFWRAQAAADRRYISKQGRQGERVTSLFTGLIKNARNGEGMYVANVSSSRKGPSFQVLETNGRREGGLRETVQYRWIEAGFLRFCREITAADLMPSAAGENLTDKLRAAEGKLDLLTKRKAEVESAIADGDGSFDVLAGALRKLDANIADARATADELRAELAAGQGQPVDQAKEVLDLLDGADGDELTALRRKLKGVIRSMVETIYLLIVVERKNRRHALVEVHLKGGAVRSFLLVMNTHQSNRSCRMLLLSDSGVNLSGWPNLSLAEFSKASQRKQRQLEAAVLTLANEHADCPNTEAANSLAFDLGMTAAAAVSRAGFDVAVGVEQQNGELHATVTIPAGPRAGTRAGTQAGTQRRKPGTKRSKPVTKQGKPGTKRRVLATNS